MATRIVFAEVLRSFRAAGFFDREVRALDPSIDLDSEQARRSLAEIAAPRDAPEGGYAVLELSVFPSGYARPPVALLATQPDPRRAVLRAVARHREGDGPELADVREVEVEWPSSGPPQVVRACERYGRKTRERLALGATAAVRERLERAGAGAAHSSRVVWRGRGGVWIELRARPALIALRETVHRVPPADVARLLAFLEAVESGAASPAELKDREDAPPGEGVLLSLLAGRRGSVRKAATRFFCPVCASDYDGVLLSEAPFDTRDGLFGGRGVALRCPRGHVLATIEE